MSMFYFWGERGEGANGDDDLKFRTDQLDKETKINQ